MRWSFEGSAENLARVVWHILCVILDLTKPPNRKDVVGLAHTNCFDLCIGAKGRNVGYIPCQLISAFLLNALDLAIFKEIRGAPLALGEN